MVATLMKRIEKLVHSDSKTIKNTDDSSDDHEFGGQSKSGEYETTIYKTTIGWFSIR